ncbi:MAG TPA: C45 family peptidase [Solirubrobacterales bacterium]
MFPIVEIEGGARERGRQYGEAARERIGRSVEAYEGVFGHYTGWSTAQVREEAERFRAPIVEFDAKYMEEIGGIAEGAGVDESDILAMNVRTEIMFSAEARRLAGPPAECSAFAVSPSRSGGGLLIGQNWDWLEHAAETTVVLRVRQDDGPAFVTVVEAGLLAKVGMNDAGLGIATNMLVSDSDAGGSGVPYHVLLRALHGAPSLPAALLTLKRGRRSSSANYLLAYDDVAVDIEAFPGGHADMYLDYPDDGLLLHFNHYCTAEHRPHDLSMLVAPSSPFRQVRAEELIGAAAGPLDRHFWERLLADHSMFPEGICHHPEPTVTNPPERAATVTAVLMEPSAGRMWLASGYPCEAPFEELEIQP